MNHRELAHKWAHAAPDASRRCGSMSFEGDTLYSYGTPIAKIYRKKQRPSIGESGGRLLNSTVRAAHAGKTLVLIAAHNYSNSTAKHISHAFRAVSHLDALRAPNYIIGGYGGRYRGTGKAAEDHAANLAHFVASAAADLASAKRAHSRQAAAWRAESAARSLKEWQTYATFFGIRRKAPAYPAAEWTAALQRADRIENPDPASLDKRERDRAKRAAATDAVTEYRQEMARSMAAAGHWISSRATRNAARWKTALENVMRKSAPDFYSRQALRSNWRLHGAFNGDSRLFGNDDTCMLRVNGDEIETSQGARVPATDAPMLWNLIERVRRSGNPLLRGLHSVQIGDYPLDRIDADGTLHAGCHTIPFSELASVARQLGLS